MDKRYVCPADVKKMLLGQARSTYWRKWASEARVRGIEGGCLAGASSGSAAKEDKGRVD